MDCTTVDRESAMFFAGIAVKQLAHLAHRVELETQTGDTDAAIYALSIQFSLLRARDVVQRGVAATPVPVVAEVRP